MTDLLHGVRAKIGRAQEHFESLKTEIVAGSDQLPAITIASEFDPQTQTVSVKIVELPEVPDRWMLIAADALQNWRASLNHLAWSLAELHLTRQGINREPHWQTEFPIATEAKNFRRTMTQDLDSVHQTIIEGLQPYQRGNMAVAEPLAFLQRLSNRDKHRFFQAGFNNAAEMLVGRHSTQDCLVTHSNYFILSPLQVGAEWAKYQVTPTGPNPQVYMEPEITLAVAFSDGFSVIKVLTDIDTTVTDIIRTFEPFF
jgi:hypothetical protein